MTLSEYGMQRVREGKDRRGLRLCARTTERCGCGRWVCWQVSVTEENERTMTRSCDHCVTEL